MYEPAGPFFHGLHADHERGTAAERRPGGLSQINCRLEQIAERAGRIAWPGAGQGPLPTADSELLKNRGQIKN